MSLTAASLAMIDDSSCGHISKESPVDSFPTWNLPDHSVNYTLISFNITFVNLNQLHNYTDLKSVILSINWIL